MVGPAQLAGAILTLAATGQPVPNALLDLLADRVLAAPLPALALAVREDGPHRLDRAIELAELVLLGGGAEAGVLIKEGKRAG